MLGCTIPAADESIISMSTKFMSPKFIGVTISGLKKILTALEIFVQPQMSSTTTIIWQRKLVIVAGIITIVFILKASHLETLKVVSK